MDPTQNYQLKWNLFANHIHSSVASSLHSTAFTDVVLHTLDGHQIPAHRFVLSACSQYLHQIFKTYPTKITTTLPIVIIMPPEINYKTLTTIIQYMYCGETTVSKEVLESVLRGGDILKVKGLWRPREGDEQQAEKKQDAESNKHRQKKSSVIKPCDGVKEKENKREREQDPAQPSSESGDKPVSGTPSPEKHPLKKIKLMSVSSCSTTKEKSGVTNLPSTSNASSVSGSEKSLDVSSMKIMSVKEDLSEALSMAGTSEDSKDFLVIKEEPIEWEEFNDVDLSENEMYRSGDMAIKPEIVFQDEVVPDEEYQALTCELCSETFMQPAAWVRHIQTHTDMQPARRQRRGQKEDDENSSFPPLQCDLCQEQFPTPAEWVRHIENTHTEYELAQSNNVNNSKSNRAYRMSGVAQKTCNLCTKTFPSHASMLIHRRTHTGEKPYTCEMCNKGFNVKSNLLRHLRTLHDKLMSSTDVFDGKESSGDSQA